MGALDDLIAAKSNSSAPEGPSALDGLIMKYSESQAGADDWRGGMLLPLETNQATGERRLAVPGIVKDVQRNMEAAVQDPRSEEGVNAAFMSALTFSPTPAGKLSWAPKLARPQSGPVAEAASRIGVDIPRAALGGRIQQNVARRLSDIPFVGTPLEKASEKAISQTGQAARNVERGYGAGSIPRAGEAARSGITDYIKNVSKESVSKQYDKVDELVNPDVTAPLSRTKAMVENINKARNAAAQGPSQGASLVAEALSRTEGLNYAGIKQLRTSIGELIDTGVLPTGVSGVELKRIYSSLTDDLKSIVTAAGGPRALAQFERANKYSSLVSANREKLATVLGAKSDEAIVDRLVAAAGSTSRADAKLLSRAKKALDGDTWNELASATVSRLGRGPDGNFSPERFVTAWGKLTQHGRAQLFGHGDLSRSLTDIATVSSRFKELNRYANPSGTGGTLSVVGAGAWLTSEPFTAATVLVGGRVMAHLLSKPATARSVARWMRAADEAASEAASGRGNLNNYHIAIKALSLSIARELGTEETAPQIEKEFNSITLPGFSGA